MSRRTKGYAGCQAQTSALGAEPETDVLAALELIVSHRISGLPVLDTEDRVVRSYAISVICVWLNELFVPTLGCVTHCSVSWCISNV